MTLFFIQEKNENKNLNITNFYCVKNNAKKNDFSQSFEEYKTSILTYIDIFGCKPYEQDISLERYLEEAGMEKLKDYKLESYFDYNLGRQILQCIKEKGECNFSADL